MPRPLGPKLDQGTTLNSIMLTLVAELAINVTVVFDGSQKGRLLYPEEVLITK